MQSPTVFVAGVGGCGFFWMGIGLDGKQKSVAGAKTPSSPQIMMKVSYVVWSRVWSLAALV